MNQYLYEQKKQQAQKTIEKKDAKLREINDILNEEITPTLKKLKEERATYLEYQKIQRELDHLTKLWLAFQFLSAQEAAEKLDHDKKMVEENLAKLQNDIVEGKYTGTSKSLSEALILSSTNPKYDVRLFMDLPVQYMKTTSSEHKENMR